MILRQKKSEKSSGYNYENPIYPEISEITAYAEKYGCHFDFDFHSPWPQGDENDNIFIAHNNIDKEEKFDRFATILESEISEIPMDYKKSNNHPAYTGQNQPSPCFACKMCGRSECDIAFTLESDCFGTGESKVSAQRLIEIGKFFTKTILRFIELNKNLQGAKVAVTINIYYKGELGNVRRFAEEMMNSGIVDEIRSEKGNIRYEYFLPLNDNEAVLLIDSWESQEALDFHHKTPMMKKIIELREKYDLHLTIERYVSDNVLPVTDRKYIRD